MITRLEIKGFKSLVNVALDLGAVNVFIGANGSGKSNLLEAIGFLGALSSGMGEFEGYRYRGVRPSDPAAFVCQFLNKSETGLLLCVADNRTKYNIKLGPASDRGWEFYEEAIQDSYGRIFQRNGIEAVFRHGSFEQNFTFPAAMISLSMVAIFRVLMSMEPALPHQSPPGVNGPLLDPTFFDQLKDFATYTPTTPQLRSLHDDIHRDPVGLGGSDLAKTIEEMMQSDPEMLGPFAIDDVTDMIEWADSIGTNFEGRSAGTPVQLRLGDRFMKDERNAVSAVEASEGALYVLFMLALVGHERSPRMFAVDNFDQALHPRLAQKLTKMVCDQIVADGTRQMFATTHNPLVLNGLNLRDDRIRLFTVDRDAAGATVVKRVEVSEALMAKAEAGFPLSELWTTGWLGGGLPQNY